MLFRRFLSILKNFRRFRLFLNKYGDLVYCNFKVYSEYINTKGIYFYKVGTEIVYIGRCLDTFSKRLNSGYAKISPKNCFLDGQSTNCRINNLINLNINDIELYILPLTDDSYITQLQVDLINKYKPKWNIQI